MQWIRICKAPVLCMKANWHTAWPCRYSGCGGNAIIDRDLRLLAITGGRYHVAQISAADSVNHSRCQSARSEYQLLVSATHLMLNENDVENYRTFAKLNPPLRAETDRLALLAALKMARLMYCIRP